MDDWDATKKRGRAAGTGAGGGGHSVMGCCVEGLKHGAECVFVAGERGGVGLSERGRGGWEG